MPEDDTDEVRLTVPPDADMRGVVEVAVAVLARRVGLAEEAVRQFRATVGGVFEQACAAAAGTPIEVIAAVEANDVVARVMGGPLDQRVSARVPPSPPG
jgi:hypothetical protein